MQLFRITSLALASALTLHTHALPIPCNGFWAFLMDRCGNPFYGSVPAIGPLKEPSAGVDNKFLNRSEWLPIPSDPTPTEILIITESLSSKFTSDLSHLKGHKLLALCTYHQLLQLPRNTTFTLARQRHLNDTIDREVELCYGTIFSKSNCGPLIKHGHNRAMTRESTAGRKRGEHAYDHWIKLVRKGRRVYQSHGLGVVKRHPEQERRDEIGILQRMQILGNGVVRRSSSENKREEKYVLTNITSISSNTRRNTTHWLEVWKHNRTAELNKIRMSMSQANHHPNLRRHLNISAHNASPSTHLSDASVGSSVDQSQEEHSSNPPAQSRSPICIEGVICDLPPTAPMCIPFEGVVCPENNALSNSEIQPRSPSLTIHGIFSDKVQKGKNTNPQEEPFRHLDTSMHKTKPTYITSQAPKLTEFSKHARSPETTTPTPSPSTATDSSFTTVAEATDSVTAPDPTHEPSDIKEAFIHRFGHCEEGQPCLTNEPAKPAKDFLGPLRTWSGGQCGFKLRQTGEMAEPDPDYVHENTLWKMFKCWAFIRPLLIFGFL